MTSLRSTGAACPDLQSRACVTLCAMSPGATHVAPAGPDVQNVGLAAPEGEGARSPVRESRHASRGAPPSRLSRVWRSRHTPPHVLTGSSTPTEDIGSYALYWALCEVVPGTLVFKATRGSAGSWLADLALGATTGLALELAAWAVASSLDLRDQLRFWPVLALALLVGRRTRGRVLARPSQPWSLPAVAVVAAAVAQVVWHVDRTFLQVVPLPPTGRFYYPDLLWHLGLVNEATRSFRSGRHRSSTPACSSTTGSATPTSPRRRSSAASTPPRPCCVCGSSRSSRSPSRSPRC